MPSEPNLDRLRLPLLVGLDVDGTLAPIVKDPAAARVPDETTALLRKLVALEDVSVALVTGRDANALDTMIQLPGAWRAVEHGSRVFAPGETAAPAAHSAEDQARLDGFAAWVSGTAGTLERKASSVAVHVRGLEGGDALLAQADEVARTFGLHARLGRSVFEAELTVGDKGDALRDLHRRTGAERVLFVGDDLTDRPAIAYAAEHGCGYFVTSDERPDVPAGWNAIPLAGTDGVVELLRLILERFG